MKKTLAIGLFVIFAALTPAVAIAAGDDGGLLLPKCPVINGIERCEVGHLIGADNSLLSNIIKFLLLYLAVPLATLSIAIAGFKFILSGSDPAQRESAKKIFWYAFLGLLIAFAAWLIVDTILKALVDDTVFNPPLEQNN